MLIRHDVTNRLRNCNWLFGNPLTTSSARARQLYWSGMLVRNFGAGARRGRSSGLVSWTWHLSRSDDVPTYIVMDRIIEQEYDHAYIDTTWWTVQYEHRRQKDLLMVAYACSCMLRLAEYSLGARSIAMQAGYIQQCFVRHRQCAPWTRPSDQPCKKQYPKI